MGLIHWRRGQLEEARKVRFLRGAKTSMAQRMEQDPPSAWVAAPASTAWRPAARGRGRAGGQPARPARGARGFPAIAERRRALEQAEALAVESTVRETLHDASAALGGPPREPSLDTIVRQWTATFPPTTASRWALQGELLLHRSSASTCVS
ncbi:MAG: hypothetical protein IPG17_14780 [Sandaracinaceae bacterium]|nr:hypothetical protein [Sandaracinaceae bacterium]